MHLLAAILTEICNSHYYAQAVYKIHIKTFASRSAPLAMPACKQMQFEENTKSNAQIRKKKYTINFKCTNCECDMYILFLYNYPLYLQWNVNTCSQHETNIVVYNLVV